MNDTLLAWDHWHIELSSICVLKCPRCPRTEVSDSLLNRQLTLQFFQDQVGEDIAKQIRKITFCGNDGDPIYCKQLVEICQWLKIMQPKIHLVIITNGSYKSPEWWRALGLVLDHNDLITWSIDGWDQHSNEQYRINCDWGSIMSGIQSFCAVNHSTYRTWATIAFRFNQDRLEQIQELAQQCRMDLFQITKSSKFGSHYPAIYGASDPLCPEHADLISSSQRFERVFTTLTNRINPGNGLKQIFWHRAQQLKHDKKHAGICLIGNKGIFLNSRGEFYPCCWTANRYAHNKQWHELASQRFNLWHRKFSDIMADPFWQQEFLAFDSYECQTKCTPDRLKDTKHVTEW